MESFDGAGPSNEFWLIWHVYNLVACFKAQTMYDKNWQNSFWTINHQLPATHSNSPYEFIILLALTAPTAATHSFCRHHHNLENKDPHISAIHLSVVVYESLSSLMQSSGISMWTWSDSKPKWKLVHHLWSPDPQWRCSNRGKKRILRNKMPSFLSSKTTIKISSRIAF